MTDRRRLAIITGASSGIGAATARHLGELGYELVLTARNAERLTAVAHETGGRAVMADCTDPDEFTRVVDAAGHLDLVVHAAGVMAGTFVRSESVETFDSVIRANLRSAFVVSTAALQVMAPGSRFVFLSSSSAGAPQPGKAAYSASKAGLNAFAGALAREVERDGIAVHVVVTGPVATPMLEDVHFPMRTLDPDDVARAIAWLDRLAPHVRLPEIDLSSVDAGPFAPEAFVPEAARARGRTEIT